MGGTFDSNINAMKKTIITIFLVTLLNALSAQGLITKSQNMSHPGCGSHSYMEHLEHQHSGFMEQSNQMMKNMSKRVQSNFDRRTQEEEYTVKVVFHIVYNKEEGNLHDSVINNQLNLLNKCFNRENEDTVNLRPDFKAIAGNPKIRFQLANTDPNGNPTSGIVRKQSTINHFGGVLPYSASQGVEIMKWFEDSLLYNIGRLSKESLGGSDAWDKTRYLNIWIGDLRVFEPKFNNLEELVFFGLATPPAGLNTWPEDEIDAILSKLNDGVYMHYHALGPNNPAKFPSPYGVYNGLVNGGKSLVHEIGHYLGLRHIWGDGDCSEDDFIDDTPRASTSSQYDCSKGLNSCLDTINGQDLPNMVENFMDYSSNACQNSFTEQQSKFMRLVALDKRGPLVAVHKPLVNNLKIYPNPSSGIIVISGFQGKGTSYIEVVDVQGRVKIIIHETSTPEQTINLKHLSAGVYFVRVTTIEGTFQSKVIKE